MCRSDVTGLLRRYLVRVEEMRQSNASSVSAWSGCARTRER